MQGYLQPREVITSILRKGESIGTMSKRLGMSRTSMYYMYRKNTLNKFTAVTINKHHPEYSLKYLKACNYFANKDEIDCSMLQEGSIFNYIKHLMFFDFRMSAVTLGHKMGFNNRSLDYHLTGESTGRYVHQRFMEGLTKAFPHHDVVEWQNMFEDGCYLKIEDVIDEL